MGRGSSGGKVSDYYKKRGQQKHGQGAKRRKLTAQSKANREEVKRKARSTNPANG